MRTTCEDCPKRKTCKALCADIKKPLPPEEPEPQMMKNIYTGQIERVQQLKGDVVIVREESISDFGIGEILTAQELAIFSMKKMGRKEAEIAKTIGCTERWVRNKWALIKKKIKD